MLQRLKRLLSINWYRTLQLNLRLLPWRQARRLPIVVQGRLRVEGLSGQIVLPPDAPFDTVRIGSRHETFRASAGLAQLALYGRWEVAGPVRIGVDSCLFVHRDAVFSTGCDVYLARNTQIDCCCSVSIGDHVLAGELYVCDSAVHAVTRDGGVSRPLTLPVTIGHDCYFGHRTMVLRGTTIPAYSVIGSGAVCCRDYAAQHPEGHVLLTGVPAQVKSTGVTPDCHISSRTGRH